MADAGARPDGEGHNITFYDLDIAGYINRFIY